MDNIHANIVRSYIRAKDENRPHLMGKVFTDSATLEMVLNTDNISFPAITSGVEAITDVLVRQFSQTYENVYTYCLLDSSENSKDELSFRWLVGMNERESGSVRVGCGRYNWHFNNQAYTLVDHLIITIEEMAVLPPESIGQIMDWFDTLPYPYCESKMMDEHMPDIDLLNTIRKKAVQ
ncbi:MAG: hypothetical protein V7731_21230 [Amphritea sp.]